MFPSLIDRLKEAANMNGESSRRGSSTNGPNAIAFHELEDYSNGMGYRYGLLTPPAPPVAPAQNPSNGQGQGQMPSMEELMQQVEDAQNGPN
jgi:hypothetical protein